MIVLVTKQGTELVLHAEDFPVQVECNGKKYILRLTKLGKLLLN